ncbi:MAG TPA: ComEC/Rec2 family competence protein [Solirubrobacterales bacterium]
MRGNRAPAVLLGLAVASVVVLALVHSAELRDRAGEALGRGMPAREAALARGFVLGDDEGIDARTIDDFRRAGLSHLLAVSGQNVALLALLAMPLLAAFGLSLRARLGWLLGLIVVYVALAGAGPTIQRAGVMGALSVLATLSGRRASRLYGLIVAAIVTLAIEPRIGADVGWQLSFAAVLGILALAAPLRRTFAAWIGPGAVRRALAEGAALTISATLATAPLIAHHFGELSTTTLVANLLVVPAVAPAMWLGMLAAAGGQVPGFPLEALNSVNALLLGYVAQIAAWCGRPNWASVEVRVGPMSLVASYLVLAAAAAAVTRLARRRRRRISLPVALALLGVALVWAGGGEPRTLGPPGAGLRVAVLDVGQGDAILLQPASGSAVLVDTGPPGADVAAKLRAAGVERLGAAIVSHDQADHVGGLAELSREMPIGTLLYAVASRRTLATARAAGAVPRGLAAGSELRSGPLRLEVLWPPRELLDGSHRSEDPNGLSLVLLLRWHGFSMLLPGDAEAEAVPLDPGPVDVLKVAHHGSEDAGLDGLLDRIGPAVAVISVGEDNPFGHPTAATMATLAEHRIRRFRTDRDGTVVLQIGRRSFRVGADG